ncbi:hypothetical protein IFT84_21255, partial [Rhizobium sp. CFBP 8762]|uniref:hypothetical protein n=1 Tax=Rhizobium sp. CFBP 8762 TaxID=2775279 RepID=UPI00178291CC
GRFDSALSEAAKSYVLERTFSDSKFYDRIKDQRISFEEFHTVLKEYVAWETETGMFEILLEQIRNYEHPDDSEDDEEEATVGMWHPLYAESTRLFRKYGLILPASVFFVASALRLDGQSPNDIPAVMEAVRMNLDNVFIEGITR